MKRVFLRDVESFPTFIIKHPQSSKNFNKELLNFWNSSESVKIIIPHFDPVVLSERRDGMRLNDLTNIDDNIASSGELFGI